MTNSPSRNQPKRIRCAIYTRKSTDESLDQDFNSLDAQRESAEAYIASMKHEGWICLPTRYDDGGFTGGNMQRPAVRRLLADIEVGNVRASARRFAYIRCCSGQDLYCHLDSGYEPRHFVMGNVAYALGARADHPGHVHRLRPAVRRVPPAAGEAAFGPPGHLVQ